MKIKLTNDYHNTEVTLIAKNGRLSMNQVKKARKVLCGIAGCTCGNDAGQRGPQEVELDFYQSSAKVLLMSR